MKSSAIIEALLFGRAEPWSIIELAKVLNLGGNEVVEAINEIEQSLSSHGVILVRAGDTVTLGTHHDASSVLEKLYKEELTKGLSKASIETLSIVMYGDEVTRGKIDYIRGVNSGFILRSLQVRGLIERKVYPRDRKRFMYIPTIALLATFGVATVTSLPDYERIHGELQKAAVGAEEETNEVTRDTENN